MKHAQTLDFLDLTGADRSGFDHVELTDIKDTVEFLGVAFVQLLADEMDKKDVSSSGDLQDSIKPRELVQNGDTIRVDIEADEHFSYQDEGVDGWAKSRGSRFKFKTKGVLATSDHVKSMKDYLSREGASSLNKYKITAREKKGGSIIDTSTRAAMTAAYMTKRYGIKAKHFTEPAKAAIELQAETELGIALKVDIINNLTR